jgi:hypothetical protein
MVAITEMGMNVVFSFLDRKIRLKYVVTLKGKIYFMRYL